MTARKPVRYKNAKVKTVAYTHPENGKGYTWKCDTCGYDATLVCWALERHYLDSYVKRHRVTCRKRERIATPEPKGKTLEEMLYIPFRSKR